MNDPARMVCPKCLTRLEGVVNFCASCGEDLRGLTPLSDTLSGPWAGKVIDGRYSLIEKLGEGGMGSVYKVEHVRMGKVLALKVLRPDLAIDKKLKQRFHQEARVVSRLSHANTIQVFDFGELDDGALYIAMEYLPGRDLSWLLRAQGAFTEERAISIGVQVLASLSEAHELGIIHRDIKPANVMLVRRKDGGDTVKVLDFGIAKLNEGEGRKHITGIADFVGTPAYMSPEQAKGEELDARSDLYSVGAMLFELVTGRGVFDGPTPMSIVSKHMTEPPPRITHVAPERLVSPGFEAVIRRALAKDPADRFESADHMRAALEKVRRDIGGQLGDYTPAHELNVSKVARREDFDQFERSLRRQRWLAPIAAVLVLGAAGFGAWQLLVRPPPQVLLAEEAEPNNEPDQANPIAFGGAVKGKIGQAISEGSDRDLYVVEIPEDQAVSVAVSAVEDMNLVLEAFQRDPEATPAETTAPGGGPRKEKEKLLTLVSVDDGRTGKPERVDGLRVTRGPLYLRISERAHPTEPTRPPRETTKLAYELQVLTTPGEERVEHEPGNDRLETASASPLETAIRAFTGSPMPLDAASLTEASSATDVFRVEEPDGVKVFALVVPPATGRLAVWDEAALEAWRRAAATTARVLPSPAPKEPRGGPLLVPLQRGSRGHALRVLPLAPERGADAAELLTSLGEPGSEYQVVFLADREGGLAGVKDLVALLDGAQQQTRARVLELARGAVGESRRLALDDVR